MQGDDPPYLSVGTAVSAKYKGAFCEAKVSKVVHIVKCKVSYKMGLGTATVTDEHINGTLRVGQLVQAKHPDNNDYVEATIMKIQDCSQYTVVFDDGDIMTLRRTALCLKGGKHFNESETLDQLPLTHPEHFGNPVMVRGRGRRSRQLKEDSSEGEAEEENEPDLELYSVDTGKVVSVEAGDKKRNKDNWFPGLIVMPSAQPTVRINMKDEFLIRSFKDGRYYTVPKKEVNEFKREMGSRVESSTLAEAVDKAIKFLDNDELPAHWEKNSLFNLQSHFSDGDESVSDSSDDEPTEEKDHFVAQLYKFMDDSGTPLNKTPTIGNKDVDLYKLFRLVEKFGGYNRVTNQNKWKTITARLKFNQNQANYNHVKQVYKKWLLSYESFYRTLGCTMLNPTRNAKKNRGRPLIRDKDRMTPVQSPRPEKEDDTEQKKEEEEKTKTKKADSKKVEEEKKRKEAQVESSDNSSDATDQSEAPSTSKDINKSKRNEPKPKEKKVKPTPGEKVKSLVEKFEDHSKKHADDDKIQQTRSKSQVPRSKEVTSPERKIRDTKTPNREPPQKPSKSMSKKPGEDDKDKKRGRKRNNTDDKTSNSDSSVNELSSVPPPTSTSPPSSSASSVCIGDKLKVYYGPTHESKVTYEAKVLKIEKDHNGQYVYLVHYTGWNTRYDERITFSRIAENLSATTKAKRLKQSSSAGSKSANKTPAKRGRGMSITGRSTVPEPPRSTTPSSITSTSSRTKSPATPVSKTSANRVTRQDSNRRSRRTSAQTDISVQSESESDERSESESELTRTRSGSKDDSETKTYRRKLIKTKGDKRKDDEDTEKEEEIERPKRSRKLKKASDVKALVDSDDEGSNQPKGREFDLNQIRSELKGFGKAIKVTSTDTSEKETVSSDESTTVPEPKDNSETETDEKKEKVVEKSSSSEDIYEFKEPEPFEFEVRKSSTEDKGKKRIPRLYDDVEKSPPKKKSPKSPAKTETKEPEAEKKRFRRTPVKKQEEVVEEEVEKKEVPKKSDDPFDKLVESPSFHIGKSSTTEKPLEKPSVVKALNMDESLSIFELAENLEENSEDRLDLSDNDAHSGELTFTHSTSFFQENFGKPSPDHMIDAACENFTSKTEDNKKNIEEVTEAIDNTLKDVEQNTVTDDDTSDMVLESEPKFENKTNLSSASASTTTLNRIEAEDDIKEEVVEEKKIVLPKQLAAVFQETDSSLLEDLCSTPQYTSKIDDLKDINLKIGTTIADTILQKLKNNENNSDMELEPSEEEEEEEEEKEEKKVELKIEPKTEPEVKEEKPIIEIEPKIEIKNEIEEKPQVEESKPVVQDFKKRYTRKFVSKKYIIDTDTESDSDSEQRLVIVPSDDDSQTSTSVDNKTKETESVPTEPTPIENTTCQVEERNFNFDNIKLAAKEDVIVTMEVEQEEEEKTDETETNKDDEPDSNLHSMLFCEETIPGSPAPAPQNEPKKSKNNVLEMPFASAPSGSSSNNKNLLIQQEKAKENQPSPVPHVLPLENRENIREASAVLDNTPPTTPESTISNLSPRGEIGGLSPNNGDNESCKSTETDVEYTNSRRSATTKVTNYSEDDSLLNVEPPLSSRKTREEVPSPCKKRRRSCKGDSENVPIKRGRKPNRSRHNSDSDDTSEHSLQDIANNLVEPTRINRSPRPSKYNFFVEFDASMDRSSRIALILQKLSDLKKTYTGVKAELQLIEKRRKKLRRREREALRAAKQESCS
ncbi:PREDICTED: AT-rich interactive domain-containing protein 4B [Nicrophorus vespilloides]|uniref:AT-rich interactive domain-containing protein 4B n=1 Tax=Nicrophorus vespilloides TaxID=110193 RepID=A0ABM1NBM9_NICVS|nr:PREDICTED: AT-rich interactive domain-containing protein 4B [Nicrophorus vespilloides]